jgi:hypothetical protein
MSSTETRLEGTTLIVRILCDSSAAAAANVSSLDGRAIVPATGPQSDGTLVKALARVHRWQGMLEEGRFASVRELAEAERVSLSYTSRILRLTLLAPDIVERKGSKGGNSPHG